MPLPIEIELTDAVAWMATFCTVGLFATGIPVCMKITKQGNTADTAFLPFVVMFCNATLWMKYGLLKDDSTLIMVNAVGSVLSFIYIIIYYAYTVHKGLLHQQLFFGCCLLFPILIFVKFYAHDAESALFNLGLLCSSSGIMLYASPFASMKQIIRTKSTECLAFPMCFANFVVSTQWLLYGYLIQDLFVQVPNFLGTILGGIQMGLFVKYPSKKTSQSSTGTSGVVL